MEVDLDVIHPGRKVDVQRLGDLEGEWDAGRIERVLSHLVANALKHGPDEPAPRLVLDGTAPDHVRITVHNGGPAIRADLLPLVYEPFTTGSVDKQGRRRGIGLGLFVVRHLVAAHGGHHPADVDRRSGYHRDREPAAPVRTGRNCPPRRTTSPSAAG